MKVISVSNFSLGWLDALEYLLDCGGKATNIHVVIDDVHEENIEIRRLLDRFSDIDREIRLGGDVQRTGMALTLIV